MWQKKFCGFLGIWVIALAFLAFSESLHRLLLVITGMVITVVAFWGNRIFKPVEQISGEVLSASSASEEFLGNKKMKPGIEEEIEKSEAVR